MPDPILDIKNGVPDVQLKKKYNLKDDDLVTLHKYNYAITKGELSESDALEMYPNASKFITKEQTPSKPSVLPNIDSPKLASESTSVNQPAQSLDKLKTDIRNEPQKIADQQALASGENIMRNAQIGEAQDRISKQTGVPANLQPIKQPVIDAPEQPSQNEIDNQKKADEAYKTPFGKMYYNIIQPMATGGGKFLGNAMGAVKRLEGYIPGNDKEHYNNMADDLVNFYDNKEIAKGGGKNAYLFAEPTKLQGNLINDGKINTSKIIPSTIENVTTMAGYVFGGEALGGGKAGLLALTYLGTEEDYRKTGKAAGLKGGQLDAFANISAGITSAIFMGLPAEQLAGKAQAKFATEAAKDIAEGMTVKQAVKKGAVDLLKATGHTSATLLGVNAADHAVHSAVDAMKDQPVFNDDLSFKAIKDEVAGTLLTAVLTTPLMMAPGMLRHYTPDAQVKSSLLYASQNLPEFSHAIDKGVAAGSYTPEQGQLIKDNIGKFSTQVTQLSDQGYSPDQATRMAWSSYKDGKITQNSKVVHENPILKETIGKEAEKDREVLKNDIKDAALGIPEPGSEITGDELKTIIKNTPNSGSALEKKVEGNTYKVDEINLQDKYDNEPAFKKSVDEFEKSKEDPEGLRTPAIVDGEGKVLDGNKRLVQQYVNGDKTARVFKELGTDTKQVDYSNQFEIPEATPEELVKAEAEVNQSLTPETFSVPDEETAQWVNEIHNDLENGKIQEPQANITEQATNSGGAEQVVTGAAGSGDQTALPENGTTSVEETKTGIDFEQPLEKDHAKIVADKLRSWAKFIEGDTSVAKSDLLALPKAVISTALKGAAELIEAGSTVAKAISHAVDAIKKHYEETGKEFDLKQTKADVKDLFKSAGIIPIEETGAPKENIKRSTSTVVKDKVIESEMSALKRQIKDKYRNLAKGETEGMAKGKSEGFVKGMMEGFKKGMREGSAVATKAQKEFETHVSDIKTKIGDMLKAAEDRGVFSSTTKADMVSSIAKTLNNAKSPLQLLKAMDRVAKIINDVEYDKHYNQATSLKSKIAKVIKGKSLDRSASNKETVKAFLKIKPDDVTDIKVYNDIAEKILSTQKAVSVKVVEGRGVISNEAHDIANRDIRKYTDEQLTHAEELAKTRTAENYQDLVDIGVIDPATMSLKEMQDVIDSVNSPTATPEEILALDNAKQAEKERAMASLIEMQQSALQEMHDSTKDLDILTPQENEIIKNILDLNPADLSLSQMVKTNDIINNIVVNGELYGAGDIAVIHDVIKDNAQMKIEIDKSGIDLSKFSNAWYDKILKGVASIHLVFDFIAKSSKLASRMQQLSGIHDIFNGHAKATVTQERTLKEYQNLKDKFGNKIDDPENRYRRGVYARVIQELGGSSENIKSEFDRVKGLIQHSYERLLRSDVDTEVQEGKLLEKVYKELLDGSENADQVKTSLQKIESNNIKLVDFWINKFNERADDVAASSEIYNNKIFERYNNYTATKAKAINGSYINAEGEDIFKATMLSKKLDASPSKTKMNRIKSSVLPANTVYDLDFDSVQGERFYDTNYDLETAPHIAKVRAFFSTPESEKLLGGTHNKKFVMESIKNAVLKQKNKQLQAPELERNAVKALNILQAKGARIALGSISQLPKQYISVASSTVANLGTDMGLYFQALRVSNKIKLFDQSSIAMRGDTKAGYNHDMDIASIDRSVLGNSFVRNSRQALSTMAKVAETAMSALVKSDVSVARTSWLSYYMQDLKKQGVDINKIDWNKAHEDYNKEAGAYAEQMVSRSQNPNNNTELGSLYRDTKGGSMILKNMILPFSSFAVNQRVRMTNDLQKLIKGGNKSEAARSLAATFLEQGIFNAIKVYGLGALTTSGARGLAAAFGFWDDQDEKKAKAYEDINIKIGDMDISTSDKHKKFVANTISDFYFSGMGGGTQQVMQKGMNWLYSNMATETYPNGGKANTHPKAFYTFDPSKDDQTDFSNWGMYGILPTQIQSFKKHASEAVLGETEKVIKGGMEGVKQTETVKITDNERALFVANFLINAAGIVGVPLAGDAEVQNANRKLQKIMEKKMQSRYGGERDLKIFSKGKGDKSPTSSSSLPDFSK